MQTNTAKLLGMCLIGFAFLIFPSALAHSSIDVGDLKIKETPTAIVKPIQLVEDKKEVNSNELTCLTRVIYYEARDQGTKGKLAIADVTLNRVDSNMFPHSICKVIKQHGQFSWYRHGKHRYKNFEEDWDEAKDIAEKATKHRNSVLPKNVLFFHADYVHPRWSHKLRRVAHIEDHIFYANKKS